MDQGHFSENREDFDWDLVEDHHLIEHYQKLLKARKAHSKVFAKGSREHIHGTDDEGFSVFTRTHQDNVVYVAINTTDDIIETTINVNAEAGDVLYDDYGEEYYTVSDEQTLDVSIPSYVDGGTMILAATDEVPPTKGNMTLYLVIGGFALLTIIGVIMYIKRKK